MWDWIKGKLRSAGAPGDIGARGEAAAAAWLRRHRGVTLLERNWRNPRDRRDEIDLICREDDVVVFVEVKARAAGALVPGYYAVDERKKRVLRRAIKAYLAQLPVKPRTFRFDVVEVIWRADAADAAEVLHFENVPLFSKHFRP
ncbi:MAG: YraN family protein [Verrucomicrobia bacterium]|nr:YraN family protein [Verrucomicrobiota bacterium]